MRSLFVLCLVFFGFWCVETVGIFCPSISPSISRRSPSADHVQIRNFPRHVARSPAMRRVSKRVTNAERLTRGLPLAPPLRRGTPTRRASPQASPGGPGTPGQVEGNIKVTDTQTNRVLGYVSKTSYKHELYQFSSQGNALIIKVNFPSGSTSGTALNVYDQNSDIGFPFVGLINLCGDGTTVLSGYLVGTNLAAPFSGPQYVGNSFSKVNNQFDVGSESAVWNIDLVTGDMSASWTDTMGSTSTVVVYYQPGDSTLQFTNDPNALGQGAVNPVTLSFVPLN